jgi:signal peptidase I
MRTAELSPELGVPLKWIEPRSLKKDAMALVTVTNEEGEKSVLISYRGLRTVDSKDYVAAPKERVKAQRKPAQEAFAFTVKVFGWTLVSIILSFAALTTTGVIQARIVLTGSMAPSINPGDVVITTSADHMRPKIGDIVTYTGKRFDGSKVADFTHRIVAGDANTGFTVKGDHNPTPDVQKPTLKDIDGVVLFTIPLIGKLLSPQIFMLLLIAGFGVWLIVDAFRSED